MKYIVNGRIMLPDGVVSGRALAFNRRISGIVDRAPEGAEVYDAGGLWVTPGQIDLHCHGFNGLSASHGKYTEIQEMSRALLKTGVTAWLPTIMTLPWPKMTDCFAAIRWAKSDSLKPGWRGAQVLGCHAEGPFINPRRKGAQDERYILPPNIEKLSPWKDVVRLLTVAPEVEGALDFIREARALGITLSMGHTDATYAQAMAGIEAGVTHATHLFNAMPPLNHREPGAVGAALEDNRVYCEVIADTFHISPALYPMLTKLAARRLVLITDSIEVAGLPDGEYDQMGQRVIVEGIHCRYPDGTIAGSCLTMNKALRNFAKGSELTSWQIVNLATLQPARAIGIDDKKGALLPGRDADIVIADSDYNIHKVFVGGVPMYDKDSD